MTIQVLYSTLGGSGRTYSQDALDFIDDPERRNQILDSATLIRVSPTAEERGQSPYSNEHNGWSLLLMYLVRTTIAIIGAEYSMRTSNAVVQSQLAEAA